MPPIINKKGGGTNYTIPFIGRVDHTIQVQLDFTKRSMSEIDADGVIKPGVVLPMHGGELGNTAGTAQVETATVVGTVGSSGAGNVAVVLTSNKLSGGSKTLAVAVANNDTASQVATKIRAALNADSQIAGFFTIGGSGADVTLTDRYATMNDSTLNLSITNGTASGLTAAPLSTGTTAGVAPDEAVMVYAARKVRQNNIGLGSDTSRPFITCAVIAVANRDLVEDNLGRPMTAIEIAALRNSKITLHQ